MKCGLFPQTVVLYLPTNEDLPSINVGDSLKSSFLYALQLINIIGHVLQKQMYNIYLYLKGNVDSDWQYQVSYCEHTKFFFLSHSNLCEYLMVGYQ